MTDDAIHAEPTYRCPNCSGEFPELDGGCCPWCGQPADGTYEYEAPKRVTRVAKANGDDEQKGLISKLLR